MTYNNDSDEFTLLLSEYENSDEFGKNNINEWKESIHNHQKFIKNFTSLDIEQLFEITGGYGKYQKRLVWLLFLNCFFISIFDPAIAFQYYYPKFYCLKNNKYVECNQTQACRNPDQMKFDYEGRYSIVRQFNLECSQKIQYQLSLLFILTGFGNFIVEFITDILGRKQLLIINNLMVVIGCLLGALSNNILFITIGNSLLVIACSLYFTLAQVIISESVPEEQRKYLVLYIPIFYQLGGIALYFISIWLLNYQNLYYLQLSIFWMFLLSSFYTLETLYYLQSKYDIKQMYLLALQLSCFNEQYNDNKIQKQFQINLNQEHFQKNLKRLRLTYKSDNQKNFFKLIDYYFVKSIICLTFLTIYAEGIEKFTVVIIQDFGFKTIQMNGIVMGLIQFFSFGIAAQKIQKLPRKFLFENSIYLSLIFSLFMFLIDFYELEEMHYIRTALCFIISTCAIMCNNIVWTYAIEIFESKNRMFGISIITLLVFCFLPSLFQIKTFLQDLGYHPILITVPCAILARFSLFFLQETIETGINQFFQNIKNKKNQNFFQYNFHIIVVQHLKKQNVLVIVNLQSPIHLFSKQSFRYNTTYTVLQLMYIYFYYIIFC